MIPVGPAGHIGPVGPIWSHESGCDREQVVPGGTIRRTRVLLSTHPVIVSACDACDVAVSANHKQAALMTVLEREIFIVPSLVPFE